MLFVLASLWLAAAPADCPTQQSSGASLPAAIDLNPGKFVPGGQVYLDVPMTGKDDCADMPPPPRDVLRGEPNDLLNPRH